MSYRFNPFTGQLDLVGSGGAPIVNADVVDVVFVAAEIIPALKVVYGSSPTEVSIASSTMDHKPLGLALNAAIIGQSVTVRCFGEVADLSFGFSANAPLFVNAIGNLVSTPVVTGYHTEVAHGLGVGKVFVNVKNQIAL
jgi:hypothetical protein